MSVVLEIILLYIIIGVVQESIVKYNIHTEVLTKIYCWIKSHCSRCIVLIIECYCQANNYFATLYGSSVAWTGKCNVQYMFILKC